MKATSERSSPHATVSTADRMARATREIVQSDGSAAVSIRRVAGVVGVTPMAVYRHYANRDALLSRVADELFNELGERWSAWRWRGDPDSGFDSALGLYLDFALQQPLLYTFLFTEVREHARTFPDDFRAGRSPTLNLLGLALADGMARGVLRPDDEWELALIISAELHGLVQLYLGGRIAVDEESFRALCGRALERLLDGCRA